MNYLSPIFSLKNFKITGYTNPSLALQAMTLKRYPAQLSLATWMNFIGGIQSAVYTVSVEHKPTAWMIGSDIDLWSILYSVSTL